MKYRELLDSHFKTAFNKAKPDMDCWSTLPLSLAGRINWFRMTIMLRFLFLSQAIPAFIPKSFFNELNNCTSPFIWNKFIP